MASKVSMVNAALIKIGASPVTSLGEDSEAARLGGARFDDVLDAVLRAYPWNSAFSRARLTALSEAPVSGFSFQHVLPADPYCLRVLTVEGGCRFRVEGRRLLCDASPVDITYIRRVTDMNQLDGLCREAVAAYLAKELAYPLTGSSSLAERMSVEYERRLREAQRIDAVEGTAAEQGEGSWARARRG
jgi:hypothetical protein